jgi:hypothetical protein
MPGDLSNFTGVGNVPLTVSSLTSLGLFGGGGNLQSMQSTKAYAYAKVTYTYTCAAVCTAPSGITTSQTAATCTGVTPNNNGIVRLTAATNGTHYGVSTLNAGSYNGPAFASATAIPGTLPAVIQSSVPNAGGTYIVRVFNGDNACFTDVTVTVTPVGCNCPSIPCGPTTVVKN